MVHNFEVWRKAMMQRASVGCASMHYYRFDDDALRVVLNLFQKVLKLRFTQGFSGVVQLTLTDELLNNFLTLLEQSQFGYIHPRKDSAKFIFARSRHC